MFDRTIKIHFPTNEVAANIGGSNIDKLLTAIGYLSTWNTGYPTVDIYQEDETNMMAVYMDDANNRKYVLVAIWNGTDYGFHS